jgi:excisionase family DNA binding protein
METVSTAPKTDTSSGIQPAVLRIAQSAAYIGCSRSFVYLLIQRGELSRIRLGGRASGIRRSELDGWLDAQPKG